MSDEDPVMSKGNLWYSFKGTEYGIDLYKFFEDQEKSLSERVITLTIDGKYDEAKAVAHNLGGIHLVKNYIEDSISEMKGEITEREEQKAYRRSIPKHVFSH